MLCYIGMPIDVSWSEVGNVNMFVYDTEDCTIEIANLKRIIDNGIRIHTLYYDKLGVRLSCSYVEQRFMVLRSDYGLLVHDESTYYKSSLYLPCGMYYWISIHEQFIHIFGEHGQTQTVMNRFGMRNAKLILLKSCIAVVGNTMVDEIGINIRGKPCSYGAVLKKYVL